MEGLVLFKKTYDLIVWIYPAVNRFPKSQRFVLGQQITNTLIDFLKILLEANAASRKYHYLRRASVELDKVRFLLRLAKDLKFLSLGNYGQLVEKINEVGRLLGGMIRKFKPG